MTGAAPRVVFDTNSLWNFAVVERLDILETRYGSRACWVDTVAAEVDVAEGYEPLLAMLRHCPWLGSPVPLENNACLTDVLRIQRALAAPTDPPSRHLGEAESIHVIEHEMGGHAWFVTDDNGAVDLALRRGIRALRTDAVLRECYAMDELRCPDPFDLLVQMADAGRSGVQVPSEHTQIC